MAKPWARYELDYINHPKFLALSPGAICLWLEGKNYCDKYFTDGHIPREALRTFRFCSRSRVEELQQVIDGYSGPLWERDPDLPGVFLMHDYLDHNDCREKVLDRIEGADEQKRKGQERLARWREKQRVEKTAVKRDLKRVSTSVSETPNETGLTEPESETEPSLAKEQQERDTRASVSPAARPADPARDPFTDGVVTERAGRFLERYQVLYPKHRKGARYAMKPARDYAAAVTLCDTWPDDRLDKLAVIFLTTDHRFAEEGSRTVPQFLALASWCDGKLAEHEATKGSAA